MKKILIIRFSSLGDVILTTPVTRALKEKFADHEVHVLLKKEFEEIFKDSPFVDRIITFDSNGESSPGQLYRFSRELSKNGYDIVIDLHRNLRSRFLYRMISAPVKLSYKKGALKRRLLVSLKIRFKDMPHTVDRYLDTLRKLGIDKADRLPFMSLSKENADFADAFFLKENIKEDTLTIAIAPGAKNRAKMYPKEKFVRLIDMLQEKYNAHVILIGADEDEELINEIKSKVKNANRTSSLTNGSIRESAAVIKRCARLVTNDTGPMHISVAVGTPVIALFGPTDKRFGFYPIGTKDKVLTKEYDCSPCSLHGKKECSKYDYKCLNDISEEEVLESINTP